ncbi:MULTISPECIES: metallophosphoesterase [Rhodomicrobium]|uniref:metallophosphoesterase family protein n=1 Tax=Rhodomicrobium TaxID=1068 RepID=UPI000B4B8529|nr:MULTISPECIES: metallophosphoesterase [Rhodomicrobium]
MFTLAHLSDIHLAPLPAPALHELMSKRAFGYVNWQRRRHQHRRDVLDRLMADLIAQKPDHVAMTGDLVNIALPEEFRQARAWLDGLGIGGPKAITVIPGNHDAYVPFLRNPGVRHWQPYMLPNAAAARFASPSGSAFPFVQLFGEIALIGLSSARPTFPGMASGWLGRRQIAEVGPILDALGAENFCRVVLIHHPPLPGMTSWQRGLHDASAFRDVLARHGAELVLHGHNHRAMIASLGAATGMVPIVGAPSASLASEQPAKRAAYNLFGIGRGGNGGWQLAMRSRVFDLDGRVEEVRQELLL